MRTNRFLLMFLAFIILLAGLPVRPAYAEDRLQTIKDRGELRVGLSADYAPFEFEHTKNGKREYAGIDVEVAKKVAKDLGVKLKIVNMQFDSLLGSLKTGKIDAIISGMSATPERKKEVDFSDIYIQGVQRMIVQKKEKNNLKTIDDFKGKGIAAQKQTTQEEIANTEMPESNLTSLARMPDAIMALNTGKVDGVITEQAVGEAYLSQNPNLAFSPVEFKEKTKGTAIAIQKGSPELLNQLNKTVAEIKSQNLLDGYKKTAHEAMFDDGSFLSKYGTYFLDGIGATILISLLGVVFGSLFGGIFAFMKLSSNKILKAIAWVYIEFIRGTPLLVQVFLVYFGTTAVLGLDLSAFICGTIALILNCAAYIAEIIRAGIKAVDKGQMEAARSLGLSHAQAMNKVIMPQAVKNILPALGNEFITVIKESSIVSVIGVSELMFNAQVVQGASFDPFTPLLIAAVVYFILTFGLSRIMNLFERRMSVSD